MLDGRKNITSKSLEFDLEGEEHEAGYLKCVFATLNVKDKDGDVIKDGAIGDQRVLISGMQHSLWEKVPGNVSLGAGRIYEQGGKAIFEGYFNMEIEKARDMHSALKFAPDLHEFSFGFAAVRKRGTWQGEKVYDITYAKTWEVSPVVVGAGVDTGVLLVKDDDPMPDDEDEDEVDEKPGDHNKPKEEVEEPEESKEEPEDDEMKNKLLKARLYLAKRTLANIKGGY